MIFFNFMKVIINIINNWIYHKYQTWFSKYNCILEFPKNYQFSSSNFDRINLIPEDNTLVQTMIKFLDKHYNKEEYLIVSLSGGVDSMVLISILYRLKSKYGYKLASATIDYSLRPESG